MLENAIIHVCLDFSVADKVRENEAVKLIRMKGGLLKLSEAYLEFAKKCSVIFEAQRVSTVVMSLRISNIVEFIPKGIFSFCFIILFALRLLECYGCVVPFLALIYDEVGTV